MPDTDTYLKDDGAHLSPPKRIRPLYASGSLPCTQERRAPVIAATEVVLVLLNVTIFERAGGAVQVSELDILVDDEQLLGCWWWWPVLG